MQKAVQAGGVGETALFPAGWRATDGQPGSSVCRRSDNGAYTGTQGGAPYDQPRSAACMALLTLTAEEECCESSNCEPQCQTRQSAFAGTP